MKVFGDSQDVSPFIRLLRIVIIAATAPFLGPGDNMDGGKNKRDQVIDEYYQEARVRHTEALHTDHN